MADDNQKSTDAQRGQQASSQGGGRGYAHPKKIVLGRPILGNAVISDVTVGGMSASQGGINPLRPFEPVIISGRDIKRFNGWAYRLPGQLPLPITNLGIFDNQISFRPQNHKGFIARGSKVEIIFYNQKNRKQVFRLPFDFEYNPTRQEDKDKKNRGAGGKGGAAGGGGTHAFDEMIRAPFEATVGKFAEGLTGGGKKEAKTPPASAPTQPAAQKKPEEEGGGGGDEADYDRGTEIGEQEVSGAQTSTAEIGGQTIAGGTTVSQAGGTLGVSGTAQGSHVVSGGGTASVQEQQTTQVFGTVSGTQQTQVTGTTSGGGQVSGGGTVTGQRQAGGTVTAGVSGEAEVTQKISGKVSGGGAAAGTVTGTETVLTGGTAAAAQTGGVSGTVSGGGQMSAGGTAGISQPGGAQAAQTSAPTGTSSGTGTLSAAGTAQVGASFSAAGGTGLGAMPQPAGSASAAPSSQEPGRAGSSTLPAPQPGQTAAEEESKKLAEVLPPEQPIPAQQQPAPPPEVSEEEGESVPEAPASVPSAQIPGERAATPTPEQEETPARAPAQILPGLGSVDAVGKKPEVMEPLGSVARELAKQQGGRLPSEKPGTGGIETEPSPGDRLAPGGEGIEPKTEEQAEGGGGGEEPNVPGGPSEGGPAAAGKPSEPAGREPLPTGPGQVPPGGSPEEGAGAAGPEAAAPAAGSAAAAAPEAAAGAAEGAAAGAAGGPAGALAGAVAAGMGAAELAEAELVANRAVNTFLNEQAGIWVWAFALPTLGVSILLGAIVGDLLWLMKDWIVEKVLTNNPVLSSFPNLNIKDLKIKFGLLLKAQIIAMNLIVVIVPALSLMLVLYIGCNFPVPDNFLTGHYTSVIGITYPPVCKNLDDAAKATGMSSLSYSLNTSSPSGGSLSLSQDVNQKISAYSGIIDACALKVVVQKESAGDANVIGCDCAANGHPEYCPDKSKTYSASYQFNWNQCSYGIGLTQWTIFPQGGSGYKAWQSARYPSRSVLNNWYGIQDFLNPDTSLQLTAQSLSASYNKSSAPDPRGKIQDAFTAYVGQSSQTANLVAQRMLLYDLCKSTGP